MCFKKKLILRFVLILFILIPGICADSLLANDASFIEHRSIDTYSLSHDISGSKLLNINNKAENIDKISYRSFSLCMADTFTSGSSETFQISRFINRSQNQSRNLRFSLFFAPFFMLSGYSLLNSEYLYIIIVSLKELVITYIHKSDGKKKLLYF